MKVTFTVWIPIVIFLVAQTFMAVWWASQLSQRVAGQSTEFLITKEMTDEKIRDLKAELYRSIAVESAARESRAKELGDDMDEFRMLFFNFVVGKIE